MAHFAVENLTFSYPGATRPALSDVSLSVERGSYVLLCGESGSGKTTLLRHLKTVLVPHGDRAGRVLFEGEPLEDVPLRRQAEGIGFVMQDPDAQVVCDKVWHELAFGLENLGVDQQAMRVRVAEMASYFGIQNWFHEDVRSLSGGQKQLLNLASVMAMAPGALLLDEPTSQLDPLAAAEFLTAVRRLNEELGVTVIITEHRLEEVYAVADRVVVMGEGRVVADGDPREVASALHERGEAMERALPTPARVALAVEEAKGAGVLGAPAVEGTARLPLTVREGRAWLERRLGKRLPSPALPPMPAAPEAAHEAVLSVKDAWFRYGRDLPDVIRGASIEARAGELLAIVGGNGTGKSTLLSLMCGARRPYRGSVRALGGKPGGRGGLGAPGPDVLMLPQDPLNIFVKQTVREDLEEMLDAQLPAEGRASRIGEMARRCGIGFALDAHPFDLSGGELQRAALAKVLLASPRVLLLDEPTKGLDAFLKDRLAGLLHELAQGGVAVVMVSHDVEFCARHASRVCLLFDGAVAAEGAPRRLFSKNSFYTTAASRMSRHVADAAVSAEEVIALCQVE